MIYTATQIKEWEIASCKTPPVGAWKPARPLSLYSLSTLVKRIKAAWFVLIGKYDALNWEGH